MNNSQQKFPSLKRTLQIILVTLLSYVALQAVLGSLFYIFDVLWNPRALDGFGIFFVFIYMPFAVAIVALAGLFIAKLVLRKIRSHRASRR